MRKPITKTALALGFLGFILAVAAVMFSADAHKEQVTTVDTDTHKVVVSSPEEGKRDEVCVVKVRITPKDAWKLTEKYAPKLEVTASEGVVVHNPDQGRKDAKQWGDKAATFLVSFISSSAGAKQFRAHLEFALCTKDQDTCQPKQHDLTWSVAVR